jgi:hypothetical protein
MTPLRTRITRRIVGADQQSLSGRARAARYEAFTRLFPQLPNMRVLDLGGEPSSWRDKVVRPREVVVLNLDWQVPRQAREVGADAEWLHIVAGDACSPPDEVRDQPFDLVFSNSVIEHVGGHERRGAFASSVHELAPHHWVQTPNRYFPLEPHWVCPGFQFLSRTTQARVMQRWPIGNYGNRHWTYDEALRLVSEVELLTTAQMRGYFPASRVLRERTMGLTKSLIATTA